MSPRIPWVQCEARPQTPGKPVASAWPLEPETETSSRTTAPIGREEPSALKMPDGPAGAPRVTVTAPEASACGNVGRAEQGRVARVERCRRDAALSV
ncbi:MAG: hypothetical protein NTV73_11350 [Hyphomicrobiales bacterium]|nr:hypothetical protein [Hyphomicrobiales bacterium]